ncbi:hypothetical protein M413DRAFT_442403 [Hebeloma cylindrosporum]|uniref:Glutamyl-tRNA(Gln) amidotransferase subunit A, mitochondrial n=1 Tax=Hebeloma cylindrosporum TaxID=76867 RepID=A0A0C3CKV8_HEBCY|nr:hypothetical protein M413DRAFT_442403 [Hebeloma cylindrosporum h7]
MRTNVARQLNQISTFHSHPSKLLEIRLGGQNSRPSGRTQSTWRDRRNCIIANNSSVNAFTHISQLPPPSIKGSLSGLSVAVKDNIATSFLPTTCSSAMLQDFASPFDATAVQLLQKSGADIVGKTNCDEFGMGSLNVHSIHGPVVNPFDVSERRSAGGSSGGSAAAVAAGMCDAALGTDTGGSVRLPASYCGVVGLKPSYGLISRWGVISYADSLDCVGILASDVDTVKRVFDSVALYDPRDPTSAPVDIRKVTSEHVDTKIHSRGSILTGLRFGIPQEYFPSEMSPEVLQHTRNVITLLQSQGAVVVPISLPSTSYALSCYYVLASAEASSNLARYDGVQYGTYVPPPPGTDITKTSRVYAVSRSAGFGPEVQKRILLGTYALSADAFDNYFLQAQKVRQLIKDDFDRVFGVPNYFSDSHSRRVDNADTSSQVDHKSDLSSYVQDVLTVPASLAGLPAISIPTNRTAGQAMGEGSSEDRWPIGVSIVGQWGTDSVVMAVASALEGLQRE